MAVGGAGAVFEVVGGGAVTGVEKGGEGCGAGADSRSGGLGDCGEGRSVKGLIWPFGDAIEVDGDGLEVVGGAGGEAGEFS